MGKFRLAGLVAASIAGTWMAAYGGGGGENMLLVVNPNDEPSLRIANAYIAARHIPSCNVLYLVPPSPAAGTGTPWLTISGTQFSNSCLPVIANAITSRGLTNQIDYIGTLGQSLVVSNSGITMSLHTCLAHLTQLQNGMAVGSVSQRYSEVCQNTELLNFNNSSFAYTPGSNPAIHHSQLLPKLGTSPTPNVQWYMAGMIGYAGQFGMNPQQVIQSLQRSVAADGTKPSGTIYYENNTDPRSTCRAPFWPPVQAYMNAHGIPWLQQENANAPVNCRNVLGAEIGSSGYSAPNGSNYLPGSWADCLTSFGANYTTDAVQTQMSMLIQAGCAGSSGTVDEPSATQYRFPLSDIWVFQHDGSTLGEAFYKSVYEPDLILFQGDLLSQAFADIPQVSFTSAPASGATVNGTISVSASASLSNPLTATGIAGLSLFLDGTNSGLSVIGSSGTFALDTTKLTDGLHEVRIVAYNNSQAASEGCALLNVAVNNVGQSVSIGGTNSYNIAWNQLLPLSVSAVQGSGAAAITTIQLQSNGRVLGSVSGASGTVTLSGTQLACDGNPVTPVAIQSNGGQIQGTTITVNRQIRPFPGTKTTAAINRNPGFDYYFYPGAAGNTLATTNFSGIATYVGHADTACLWPNNALDPNVPSALRGANSANMAITIKGLFTVTTAGEYALWGKIAGVTSAAIQVDGVTINGFDLWNGSTYAVPIAALSTHPFDSGGTAYLLPGEHSVTIQLVQKVAPTYFGTSVGESASIYFRTERPGVPLSYQKGGGQYYLPAEMGSFASSPMFYTVLKTNGH